MAGRLALERGRADGSDWSGLLNGLSRPGSHGSWRRHALLSVVRSERAPGLMAAFSGTLLADGGAILAELARAVRRGRHRADRGPPADGRGGGAARTARGRQVAACRRDAVGASPARVLRPAGSTRSRSSRCLAWCGLAEVFLQFPLTDPALAGPVARLLFGWLVRLDVRGAGAPIPDDPAAKPLSHPERGRFVDELRQVCLLFARHAPEEARAYMAAVGRGARPLPRGAH